MNEEKRMRFKNNQSGRLLIPSKVFPRGGKLSKEHDFEPRENRN